MSVPHQDTRSSLALWLIPSAPGLQRFRGLIDGLARDHSAPPFHPHITLFHPLDLLQDHEVKEQIEGVLQGQGCLTLSCKRVHTGDHFFQCVLVPIEITKDLAAIRARCEACWGRSRPFFPHLSLMYGDLSVDDKESVARSVNEQASVPESVLVDEIWLVDCGGPVENWVAIEKWTLSPARALLAGSHDFQSAIIETDSGNIVAVEACSGVGDVVADVVVPEDCFLLPGLFDSHVHLNEPGRTAWEGFQTGTLAAVSGGIVTLVDMPLNSLPPTTTVANLRVKQAATSEARPSSDIAFWGGIIPGNQHELVPMLEAGVKGFKCFLIDSGVEEFPQIDESGLILACDALEGTNALILFHAELEDEGVGSSENGGYSEFLSSRPDSLELNALTVILRLARRYPGLRFHIVHLSTALAVPEIKAARRDGVRNLTVETCFHYLTLRAEDIADDETQYKCCPPIRSERNRQLLREALLDGTINFVVSDHSPCVLELKKGDFMTAWGGVSGLGLGLSLMWSEFGVEVGMGRIAEWLGSYQAAQLGMPTKSSLAVGAEASFVVFRPDAEFQTSTDDLRFKNKISPYLGHRLRGRVVQTFIRGELVWDESKGLLRSAGKLV